MRQFSKKISEIGKVYKDILKQIPSSPAVNSRYFFLLDTWLLTNLLNGADSAVDRILAINEPSGWFYQKYVSVAYQRGTAQEHANLSYQSEAYATKTLQQLLISEPYQLRLALVRARVFEQMKWLGADIKKNMALVLTDGVGRGQSPIDIGKRLSEQVGIEIRRAYRIARTEVTTALRRARWEETEAATDQLGLNTRMLHLSALSPTTRRSHALRHGYLFTVEQVRDWYSKDANAINCKCSQIAVLVDADGKALNQKVIDIAIERFKRAEKKLLATNCSCCGNKAA